MKPETVRRYRQEVARFLAWCDDKDRDTTDPRTVAAYLAHAADWAGAVRANFSACALSWAFRDRGMRDPKEARPVRMILAEIRAEARPEWRADNARRRARGRATG